MGGLANFVASRRRQGRRAFSLFTGVGDDQEAQIHQLKDYSVEISFVPLSDNYTEDIAEGGETFRDRTKILSPAILQSASTEIERTKRGKLPSRFCRTSNNWTVGG